MKILEFRNAKTTYSMIQCVETTDNTYSSRASRSIVAVETPGEMTSAGGS